MRKCYCFLLSVIFLASCKKDISQEEIISSVSLGKAVVVENGYLKFRDQKALDSMSTILLTKDRSQLDDWEKQFRGFNSYRSIFKAAQDEFNNVNDNKSFANFKNKHSELISIKADSSISIKFGTPLSSYFINKNGEFKVGDELRRYTNDNRLSIYTKSSDNNGVSSPVLQKVMSINHKVPNKVSLVGTGPGGSFLPGLVHQALYYNSSYDRRLYVELWYDFTPPVGPTYGTGRFYFVTLQEIKRTFGGWRANNTDYYQNSISWNWTAFPSSASGNYIGGYIAYPNTTGPILFSMSSFSGSANSTWGSAHFVTGGVPLAPAFVL